MTVPAEQPEKTPQERFLEFLCAPERGPVEWERPKGNRLVPRDPEVATRAYRQGLRDGMRRRRSAESRTVGVERAAYALGWMRGRFPRPFKAEVGDEA